MPRTHSLEKTRNIGIMAHIDAGKTTTSERILYYSGKVHKIGETHDGGAVTDWMDQEKERGITITSACITTEWREHKINVIDTPGHVDFTVEVERSLKVLDGAITVLCARGGVQPQSETVWRQADKYKVPRLVYVNKMDTNDANFYRAIESLRTNLGANPVAVQIPVGDAETFKGIIDLVEMKYYFYNDEKGKDIHVLDIPADMKDKAAEYRTKLLDVVVDYDDALFEKVLGGEEPTIEEIRKAIRTGTLAMKMQPAFCGSSYKNKGVQKLLDGVVDFLPSPLDIPAVKGTNPETEKEEERKADDKEPFSGLAFKVMADRYGELVFFRVYSGIVTKGSYVYNATKDKKERVSRIVVMYANSREEVESAHAGDIVSFIGLSNTTTADTLCDEKKPIVLESMSFAEPVIKLAVEPKTKGDQEKMTMALIKLASEDPTFKVQTDKETGQTIIAGMGELHLEIMIDRMKREFNVEVTPGTPQVSYRETFKKTVESEGKHVKQSGGKGQYGHCWLRLEPLPAGEGFKFVDKTVGGSIPKEYIPAVEKGLIETKASGVLAGYEVVDFQVTVYDGSYHDVDSSEMAFKIAASMAFKDGMRAATPILLEPITRVQVTVPAEYMGDIMGNLTTRRGSIQGTEQSGTTAVVNAEVPLSEMFGYVTDLRSRTKGKGSFTMEVVKYEEVPSYVATKIIEGRAK